MIRPIMKDIMFLKQKSTQATKDDLPVARDLLDTLYEHRNECVGMAANMIGVSKRIIVVNIGLINIPMINPTIISKSEPYETEEGCLSLMGKRKTTRYNKIRVCYYDLNMKKHLSNYEGFTAQIIQHEMDHLEGIII